MHERAKKTNATKNSNRQSAKQTIVKTAKIAPAMKAKVAPAKSDYTPESLLAELGVLVEEAVA